MADFRALCAELVDAIDSGISTNRMYLSPVMLRTRAALAQPESAVVPVPVSDRLPKDADVNKFGQVWWFDSPEDNWILDTCEEGDLEWLNLTRYTHWLPYTAIPTPTRDHH
jgi:hypothetical protein